MKKINIAFAIILFATFSLVQACRKTPDKAVPPIDPANNSSYNPNTTPITKAGKTKLNQLFSALRTAPETLTVTAGRRQTVYGSAGTRLRFYPNSFKNKAGNIITSGTITIKLTEMYKPGEMIANRASTTANGQLLKSGGQVYISATMGGQEVIANKYGIDFAAQPDPFQPMALFSGSTANADSITTWTITDTSQTGTTTGGTTNDSTLHTGFSYIFDSCTDFGWINCDYFSSSTAPRTNVTVTLPDTSYNESNTEIYLIFPDINSVTYLGNYSSANRSFSLSTYYWVPEGITVNIVAITNKNGNYYYYEQTGTIVTSNLSINASIAPQSLSYIKTRLSLL